MAYWLLHDQAPGYLSTSHLLVLSLSLHLFSYNDSIALPWAHSSIRSPQGLSSSLSFFSEAPPQILSHFIQVLV